MKKIKTNFLCNELSLEGILYIPEGTGPFPAVVVCHPHPLYGGSMDNDVIDSISEELVKASLVSFKFNFRGVGGSQGEYSQGIGEQEDVDAAISFVTTVKEVDAERIGLAGYSAGAGFGLPVGAKDARIKALAAVSPPLPIFDFTFLKDCPKPKFLISGGKDELIPVKQFLEFCQNLPGPKECDSIEEADHFWSGYVSSIAVKVADFFTRVL